MRYYEVLLADSRYHGDSALTYSHETKLAPASTVSVPLRQRLVTGFISKEVSAPSFETKPIKSVISQTPLPAHCLELALWLAGYYCASPAEALRQFAPSTPSARSTEFLEPLSPELEQLEWEAPLTAEQKRAIREIQTNPSTTVLLHGETGSGKTRVYLELARQTLKRGRSVILLTPEISLTAQLAQVAGDFLGQTVFVLHSQLPVAKRKKIWREILESKDPVVVVGPRSALFSPLKNPGLIVVDEAHEPAYKQDQSPRYHTSRVASQLGNLTDAKVILGTATPLINDYYLAQAKNAVVRMSKPAVANRFPIKTDIVDLKDRAGFGRSIYLSSQLLDAINTTLSAKKQIVIYLNRRGSARTILCSVCGWHFFCPNCDIPLVYHADEHLARCHTCGYRKTPPVACPECANPQIIYKSAGTKALTEELKRLFPLARVTRFDSDSVAGERLNELYKDVLSGQIDILVGTQLLAKGLDLPKLALVGVVSAETSLSIPDFTAEERTFQLLYQVIGRVGRGHTKAHILIQSFDPANIVIQAAATRDWKSFYKHSLAERRQFKFPPFSHLAQFICRKSSADSAKVAAEKLKSKLASLGLPVEIIGPVTPLYARRANYHYSQLVIKSKKRSYLTQLASNVPSDWVINLDPSDLL